MKIYTPEERVQQARLGLVTGFVFFGTVFLRLNVHEDPTCETAWTDGESIGYNLDYLKTLTQKEIIGLFVHECLHVILKHPLRAAMDVRYKANHLKWNYACDYALNPTIEKTNGMDVNENWLLDMYRWSDTLAEHIFDQLPDDFDQNPKCKGGDGQGTSGPSGGPVAPGEVRPWKEGKATTAEVEHKANEIDQWVQAGAMKAQGMGQMDGGTKQIIKKVVEPKVFWGDELQNLCDEITRDDYTWTMPNPRYVQHGVYLPSMYDKTMPDLLFYVDVSGSLSNKQLVQIKAEIRTIVALYNVRIIVVYWSTKYKGHEEFYPEDVFSFDFSLNPKAGGGTGFSQCWDWWEDQDDIDPKGLVFFTDCECSSWPMEEPPFPVVWAHVSNEYGTFNDNYLSCMPDYGSLVKVRAAV